jgi:hypothetical protein
VKLPILTPVCLTFILFVASANSPRALAQTPDLPDAPSVKLKIEKSRKRDIPYLASEAFFTGGTMADMYTTAEGLNHPTIAYRSDGTLLAYYHDSEAMFPGSMWSGNASAVVTVDSLLNAGFEQVDRWVYRGGHRRMAILLNLLNGAGHVGFAIHNMQVNGSADERVASATHYHGLIYWGQPPLVTP